MENKYKYLLKNTAILSISNFSSKILVFLMVPLYTSVLSTSEYGSYDLINTTIQLFMPILCANIYEGVTVFLLDKNEDNNSVISIGIKYILFGILIWTAFCLFNRFLNFWGVLSTYFIPAILMFISSLVNQFCIQVAKGLEQIKVMGIAGVVGTCVTVFSNIFFLLIIKIGLPGFFAATILGSIIPALFIAISIKIWNYFTFHLDKKLQRAMLIFSIPLIMNALGWWMNNVSDRYVVTFMCGVAANGIYSISYKIPSILNVLQSIFTQSWQISAIKEYNKDGYQDFYGNMLEVLNVFLCCASIVLIAMSKILAIFLYAKDFYSAWMYVPFLLLSSSVNADSGVLGPILSAKKNSKALASSAIAGALANIALNFLLVFFIGVQGAAVATFISSVIIYVARRVAVGKDIHLRNKFGFLLTWVIGVVQALFMIYIDSYIPQCVCLVVFIAVYWKVLKGNMNKIIRLIRRK